MVRFCVAVVWALLLGSTAGCSAVGDDDLEVKALFPEVAGLYVGNDVGVLGIPVGTITKLEPRGDAVEVTMTVTDPDVVIPAGAAAVVVSRSVATDRYVELTPVYRGGEKMKSGSTIPLERTRTPVDFDEVLGSMSSLSSALVDNPRATNSLNEVLQVTAAAFNGNGVKLRSAVQGLADLVDTVHGQRDDIFASMASLDRLAGGLVKNEQQVRRFVGDLDVALELLSSERHAISGALTSLSRTVNRLTVFSKENRGAVKASVTEAQALVRTLIKSRRDLAETLETLPLATQNVANTAAPNGNLWVRFQPAQLTPLAPVLEQVCKVMGPVCNLATFPDLTQPLDLLGGGR